MTDTERALDEIATLLESGGLGSSSRPTKSVAFRGPHTAGNLESFQLDGDYDLVCAISTVAANVVITNGRTFGSIGQGFHTGGSVITVLTGASGYWTGRQRYNSGDWVYLDSNGNLGTSDIIILMFERR